MYDKKKKEKSNMSEPEKNAKMGVLSHLRDMAQESMGDKLHGIKKVSVMSDSPEGLEHGLDKAKELAAHLKSEHDAEECQESPEEEAMETPMQEAEEETPDKYEEKEAMLGGPDGEDENEKEHTPMPEDSLHHSPEDVDAHIEHLKSLKKHMMKNKK